MKPIERTEVLGLADYEMIRDRFRTRVIQEKKIRRVALGEHASCVFENRDTILLQIQEMLRTERITREAAVKHEIDTYNELLPGPNELSATVLIEIQDKDTRENFLVAAQGLERKFALVIDGTHCPATWDAAREFPDRTTAVHYVKFPLPEAAARALRDVHDKTGSAANIVVEVCAEHPRYTAKTRLSANGVLSIAEDLA